MKRLCFFMLSATLCASWASAAPQVVYVNGKVVTVGDQFTIAEGFAIEADRFIAVGTSREMLFLADAATQVVDLGGRTVTPGLIDNHNHFVRGAQHWSHLVRLERVTSKHAALERLQGVADGLTEDQWQIALGGWNEEQFTDADARITLADFVVLDGDYLEIDAASIGEMQVLRTAVGGRVVYDTGAL